MREIIAEMKGSAVDMVTPEDLASVLESVNHRVEWVKASTCGDTKKVNTNSTEGGHSHVRRLLSELVLTKGVTDPTSIALTINFAQWMRNASLGFRIGEQDHDVTFLTRFLDTRSQTVQQKRKRKRFVWERALFCLFTQGIRLQRSSYLKAGLLVTELDALDQKFVDQVLALADEEDALERSDDNPRPRRRRRLRRFMQQDPYLEEVAILQVHDRFNADQQRPRRRASEQAFKRLADAQIDAIIEGQQHQ
ncbi:MAG: hypothetical protein MHM6MM_006633 [Cercozoa sp. M6MM]